jgi:hypothetical protein
MDIWAILLLVFGIALIVIGWNGTYANVWYYLSNQGSPPGQQGQMPPMSPGSQQNSQMQQGGPTYHPAYQRFT